MKNSVLQSIPITYSLQKTPASFFIFLTVFKLFSLYAKAIFSVITVLFNFLVFHLTDIHLIAELINGSEI